VKEASIVDFRSKRVRLGPECFALSSGKEISPTDLVSKKCWNAITHLPDDVSLRTTDHYGTVLKLLDDLSGEWTCLSYALQKTSNNSAIAHTASDAGDHFHASIYNAVTGYYRLAFTSLRGVVENMSLGMQFHIAAIRNEFADWIAGEEFSFGWAADHLTRHAHIAALEQNLATATGDNLFRRRGPTDPGGLARRLFRGLSRYAHGAPGYNDGDMWRSNGPVFASKAFEMWIESFLMVYCLAVLESRLADQKLVQLGFDSPFTARDLFHYVVEQLAKKSGARRLFSAVPVTIW
jgi:hypothetical protein